MKGKTKLILIIIAGIFLIPTFGYYFYYESTPGELDSFTQCISDKRAVWKSVV